MSQNIFNNDSLTTKERDRIMLNAMLEDHHYTPPPKKVKAQESSVFGDITYIGMFETTKVYL